MIIQTINCQFKCKVTYTNSKPYISMLVLINTCCYCCLYTCLFTEFPRVNLTTTKGCHYQVKGRFNNGPSSRL